MNFGKIELQNLIKKLMKKKKNNNIHVTTYMQQHTAAGSETSYEVLWFVDNPVFNVELLKQLK